MILDAHLPLLRDKFVRSSWSNPSLETNISIKPTLLNLNFPTRGSLLIMRRHINMPTTDRSYDVYSLERLSVDIIRQNVQKVGKWVNLVDFCTVNNLLMFLGYQDELFSGIYSNTYIMYMPNGTVILAVPTAKRNLRTKLTVYLRTSNDSLETDIDVEETHLNTALKVSGWLANYNADSGKGLKQYLINGIYVTTPTVNNVKVGTYVTTITDTSTKLRRDVPLVDLEFYTKDSNNYYLISLMEDQTDVVYSRYDSVFYLMKDGVGKRVTLEDNNIVQITDNEVGVKVDVIEAILANLGWTEGAVTLRIYTKEGIPPQRFVNNDNYWYSLQQLPYDLRTRALLGAVDAPDIIYAHNYHLNSYNVGLDLEYEEITADTLSDVMAVATWDYNVNRSMVPTETYNNNLTDLIPAPNVPAALVLYCDGVPTEVNPTSKDDMCSHLKIGYKTPTTIVNSHTVDASLFTMPIIYSKVNDEFTRLKPVDDYSIINGNIEIKVSYRDVYCMELASSYIVDLDPTKLLHELPLSPALYGMGYISIIVNLDSEELEAKTLTPNIDFRVHEGLLAIHYGLPIESIKFIFQPTLDPQSTIIETGFTRNGSVSVDGSYLELDPNNYYFIIDGKIMLPSEVDWDLPFINSANTFENAKPYAIIKALLSNCDGDLETVVTKRREYESNLRELAAFKDTNLPIEPAGNSIYNESYRLTSVFVNTVLNAALNGDFNYDRITINALGLDNLLSDYLYLLEDDIDVSKHDLVWEVIDLRAHNNLAPVSVNANLYYLLGQINAHYMNGRIFLNSNFRITA